jgi:prolyl-tRNA synthetase
LAKGVTPKSEDYARWYTDIITKAEMADYGPVKGTMVIRPYGFSVWDSIKEAFDNKFKETGHVNAYFPLFIPKSFLSKEADHIEGFAKECAVVTHSRLKSDPEGGGVVVDPDSKLDEEIIVRPTSETIIWSMYKKWINSYRDLPILINQWANVVRWEMRTRLFLRTSEFLWQEGHTAHATEEEARQETLTILEIYRNIAENILAIPVITGTKSEAERFAGAIDTYCIEAMMGDKKALQAGTSHYLGQNFAKAFDVKFQTENNNEELVYATSWGVSTRLVGALIMVHGDDKGLRLPPKVAPIQIVIIPIFKSKEGLLEIKNYLKDFISELKKDQIRFEFDDRSKISPGFKFNEWEMKGVPIRVEIGSRDIESNSLLCARRDTSEKKTYDINSAGSHMVKLLETIQDNMFNQALEFRNSNTFHVTDYNEFEKFVKQGGFVQCYWDGENESEAKIKKETKATIRCILEKRDVENKNCIYSGKPAKYEVVFARSY